MRRALLVLGCCAALSGCTNPDAPVSSPREARTSVANPGEPSGPPPPSPRSQVPAAMQRTPVAALAAFARLYMNWDYRTLAGQQQTLAAMSVGPARLAEQQAAVSSRADGALSRGRIHNHGQVSAVAPSMNAGGVWVIVTREQTGGDSQYEGLPSSYHVTLARVVRVPGGYAVSEWLPQS
jgi:hypothetical protein